MNEQLQNYARRTLKEGLAQTSNSQQLLFKRMYAHNNLNTPINKVVDNMKPDQLDWAMEQVKKTLKKNEVGIWVSDTGPEYKQIKNIIKK